MGTTARKVATLHACSVAPAPAKSGRGLALTRESPLLNVGLTRPSPIGCLQSRLSPSRPPPNTFAQHLSTAHDQAIDPRRGRAARITAAIVNDRAQSEKMMADGVRPVHGRHGHGTRKNAKFNPK